MIWQDVALGIIGFSFSFALIPSIISKHKPAKWSCLLTATGLTVMVVIFGTMGLWLTVIANSMSALAWWILLFQNRRR